MLNASPVNPHLYVAYIFRNAINELPTKDKGKKSCVLFFTDIIEANEAETCNKPAASITRGI